MRTGTRFSQLSASQRTLVRVLQSINFGSIELLVVRCGEPVFSPEPTVLIEVKLDSEPEPRPESDIADFELRAEIIRLLAQIELLGDGSIERIEVRHGIPWRAVIERPLRGVRR
jgi:hypothetical protein